MQINEGLLDLLRIINVSGQTKKFGRQMTLKFKIIFLLILTLSFNKSFGQTTITKKDLCGKWDIDSFADKMKIGDTLLFKSKKKANDTFLKRNGTLQKHTFYGHCGNKFFADYFRRKPPEWEIIGSWYLSTVDNKTILTMNIGNRALTFLFATRDKKQFKFILQNI